MREWAIVLRATGYGHSDCGRCFAPIAGCLTTAISVLAVAR